MQLPVLVLKVLPGSILINRFLFSILLRIFIDVLDYKLSKWINLSENGGNEASFCVNYRTILCLLIQNRHLIETVNFIKFNLVSLLGNNRKVLEDFIQIALSRWLLSLLHKLFLLLFVKLELLLDIVIKVNN